MRHPLGPVLLAGVALVLATGCGTAGDEAAPQDPTDGVPNATVTVATAPAGPERFCPAYRGLEEAQAAYDNAEEGAAEALRGAADALLATGFGERMPPAARAGLASDLAAAYAAVEVRLDPAALDVGTPGDQDPAVALAEYVDRRCPPR